MPSRNCPVSIGMLLAVIGVVGLTSLAASAEPKVSTYAPAEDLANQADCLIEELDEVVACEEEYGFGKEKLARDSNTLAIIALALGLHDQPNKHRAHAGALMKAAQQVAAANDFHSAGKAVAAVKAAAKGKCKADVELKWEKVASLPELMKQVPLIHTKLNRCVKPEKFESKAKETAGYTAVLAAIAQGTVADASAAKTAEQEKQWQDFSVLARDCAGAVNAAIHRCDQAAADAAMKRLTQSCDDCHAVFYPKPK